MIFTTPEEFKTATITALVSLNLCLRKTRSGKSPDYREAIFFEKVRFRLYLKTYLKLAFSKFSGLENVFEKLRFRDRLVWTVSLTVEIKLRFRNGLVWTVDLTVEIKVAFSNFSSISRAGPDSCPKT